MTLSVLRIERLDLPYRPRPWRFADQRRTEIDSYFADQRRRRSGLWNGRVLLMRRAEVEKGMLRGEFFDTDFASFMAWRDWGFPDPHVTNCFAMGALRSRDGAFLLGVMGAHTANPGRVYFPAGTPDSMDIANGEVDLAGSVQREIAEEIGLGLDDYAAEPGWHGVFAGRRLALIKTLHSPASADALERQIAAFLAAQTHPELCGIRFVAGPTDLHSAMPDFVPAFLRHVWS